MLTLMCLELMFLSIIILMSYIGHNIDDVLSLIFIIIILTIASSESALGLAIVVMFYRKRGSINIGVLNLLRG